MPDGVEYDAEIGTGLKELAAELKLTQEQAQKFADLGGKMAASQLARQAAVIEQWGKDAAADKEFGGENLQQNLGIAKAAIEQLAPGLRPVLESTGLGNHPEVIRAFWKAGQLLAEDKPPQGGSGIVPTSNAQALYPNSKMNA
jgi:hypothetical protein